MHCGGIAATTPNTAAYKIFIATIDIDVLAASVPMYGILVVIATIMLLSYLYLLASFSLLLNLIYE